MNERLTDIQQFLDRIHKIENKVVSLIKNTNLSEQEKRFILDHIIIVPGQNQESPKSDVM